MCENIAEPEELHIFKKKIMYITLTYLPTDKIYIKHKNGYF